MKSYISLLGFLLFSITAFAQNTQTQKAEDTATYKMAEVEITASTNPNKKLIYIPQSIVKLNEVELKRGTGLFLNDAINANTPGVYMQSRTSSAGQAFNIRGYGNGARGTNGINSNFDNQGSKIYLNGIPITDPEGITVMDDIDFGSVGNVEIIKGPAGSLYGLAIAGVVNLRTIKPEKNKISIGQDVLIGSYGLQRYTTHLQIGTDSSTVLVNYGRQQFDGFMPHTASHKDFVNMFGEFQLNAKQSIDAYFGYSNSYDERNGELTIKQYNENDFSGNPNYIKNNAHSEVIGIRAGVGHTYKFSDHFSNTTTLFGSGFNTNASSAGGWTDRLPVNYGLRSTLDMKFALSEKTALSGVAGIETQMQNSQTIGYAMVVDSQDISGYNIIGNQRSNQSTVTKTTSLFTEWTLTLPYDFGVTAGIGVSNMDIELNDRTFNATTNHPNSKRIPTHYENSYKGLVSPHFAINKVFAKKFSVFGSLSYGYKAPVSSYFFIPTTGEVNKDLIPEIAAQIEAGIKGSLFKDKLYFELTSFSIGYIDRFTTVAVPNPSNTATLYTYMVNGGSQNNKGIEFLAKVNAYQSKTAAVKYIRPFVNFTYSNFKYLDFKFQSIAKNNGKDSLVTTDFSGNKVAGVPPVVANVGVDFALKFGLYGNATYSYRDQMPFTSDGKNIADSYSLLNAKIGFRRELSKHFDLDVFAGANNITGEKYYYMVFLNQLPDAYIPAPNEINYFGGVNLKYNF